MKVFSILGSTGGVLVIFIIPGILLSRNILGQLNTVNHDDYEALQPQEEAVPEKSIITGLRLGGGILMLSFGCLIFFVTAYLTVFGKENVE